MVIPVIVFAARGTGEFALVEGRGVDILEAVGNLPYGSVEGQYRWIYVKMNGSFEEGGGPHTPTHRPPTCANTLH